MNNLFSESPFSYDDDFFYTKNLDHYDDLVDLLLSSSNGIKVYSALCIFGPIKSVNLAFLQTFMTKHSMQFIYLNCLEVYSEQIFLISILQYNVYHHACFPSNLLDVLKLFLSRLKDSTLFMICDNAEFLLKYDSQLFSSMICLFDQPSCFALCLIFLTEVPLNTTLNMHYFKDVIHFYVPPCSRDEITQLILADTPRHDINVLHLSFLQYMWPLFSILCQNLAEFNLACCETFPYYIEPVEKLNISSQEPRLLWKMLESQIMEKYAFETAHKLSLPGFVNTYNFHRISFLSRVLLISAHLSSHSILRPGPKRCSTHTHSIHCKPIAYSPDDLPYVAFSFEKLITVFYRVRGMHKSCSINVFTLITSLISIQLFIQKQHSASWNNAQAYFSIINEHIYTILCKSTIFN